MKIVSPERIENDQPFNVLVIGALYAGGSRSLAADVLAVRALGGAPLTVCTSIVAAGNGVVTDVIEVPSDSVDAQLEHVFKTSQVSAAKVGIMGSADSASVIFRRLEKHLAGPFILDLTLSGPSGEDIADQRTLQVAIDHLSVPDLVTLRWQDAELVAGMQITSLDDAQVAVQRLARLGARHVLIRCGTLPARFFETEATESYHADLYYDGTDFSLFEGPALEAAHLQGASSALTLAILKNLLLKRTPSEAIQSGKAYVAEALRHAAGGNHGRVPNFFWKLSPGVSLA